MPAISVIIPVYNRAETIEYCLTSVLRQSISNFEVIVVDDGSTDNTVEIVKNISDSRVRCITLERNFGAQAARNRGILEAQSEWISFLDSDDEWVPEKLERQLEALRHINFAPMVVVHSDCWRYEVESGKKYICELPLVEGDNVYKTLLTSTGPMFQGILVSKAALERIHYLDENVPSYQEWETSIRLAKECRFVHIREPLFVYHLHAGETISKNKRRDLLGYQYIIDRHRDDILRHCGTATMDSHLIANATKAIRWGFFSDATEILVKTTKKTPTVVLLLSMAGRGIDLDSHYNGSLMIKIKNILIAYVDRLLHDIS